VGVNANNVIQFTTGNNTATGGISLVGTTTVTDNAYHYVVCTFNNNFGQVYLDGTLEISGFLNAPVYAATNYVRIGCYNAAGGADALLMNGQIDDIFLINGYALDEATVKAKYVAATAQGTGNVTINKKGIITKVVYSAGTTTMTIYGGTDYQLANATMSNPYYSLVKVPFGFPTNVRKWTYELQDNTNYSLATPTQNQWYNANSFAMSIPIGSWNLFYKSLMGGDRAGTSGGFQFWTTMSTANNSESDTDLTFIYNVSGNVYYENTFTMQKLLTLNVKTTYYMNLKTGTASVSNMYSSRAPAPAIIRAICAYL
jgi:hypothetical protein